MHDTFGPSSSASRVAWRPLFAWWFGAPSTSFQRSEAPRARRQAAFFVRERAWSRARVSGMRHVGPSAGAHSGSIGRTVRVRLERRSPIEPEGKPFEDVGGYGWRYGTVRSDDASEAGWHPGTCHVKRSRSVGMHGQTGEEDVLGTHVGEERLPATGWTMAGVGRLPMKWEEGVHQRSTRGTSDPKCTSPDTRHRNVSLVQASWCACGNVSDGLGH